MSTEMTEIVSEAVTYLDALEAIESVSYPTMAKAIDARDAAVELSRKASEALGPKPDYDDISQWVADLMTWNDLVDRLHPTDKTTKLAEDPLSCGPPGHDYSDHIVDYKGKAILDINLPEGEKGSPITGPGWTEVDPEQWDNMYKHKNRRHKAAQN